jgi:hypothetical protein
MIYFSHVTKLVEMHLLLLLSYGTCTKSHIMHMTHTLLLLHYSYSLCPITLSRKLP